MVRVRQIHADSRGFYGSPRVAGHAGVPYLPESATTQRLDQVWVGDMTYLKVAGKWRYMAPVMDKHSRRIVGWCLGARRDAALTREALAQSDWSRCVSPGVVFHSDPGIEFANYEFRKQLSDLGMVQSMNRPGRMNDNAHMSRSSTR